MKHKVYLWPASLVVLHLAKVSFWFHRIDFSSPFPIVNHDYIIYFARALRAQAFFDRSGRYWGYDPFEMAGTIAGPVHEAGSHFMSLISYLLYPLISIKNSQLALVIGGITLAPFLTLAAVRLWRGTWTQAWTAFGLVTLMYGVIDNSSSNLVFRGVFGFQMACFVGLVQVALFYDFIKNGGIKSWAFLTLASAVVVQLHPGSVFIVGAPLIYLYVTNFRSISARTHILIGAALGVAILSNWYWIRPYWAFRDWQGSALNFQSRGLKGLIYDFNPFQHDIRRFFLVLAKLYLLKEAMVAVAARLRENKNEGGAWIVLLTGLFLFGYFGSILPGIRDLQPGRYMLSFWITVYILAGFSLLKTLGSPKNIAAGAVTGLTVFTLFLFSNNAPPFATTLHERQQALIDAFKIYGPLPGRLLLECGEYDAPNINEIIPSLTKQPLLGGGNPGNILKTRNTLFMGSYYDGSGKEIKNRPLAFGKYLEQLDEAKLEEYLDLYNISAVAAYSRRSIAILNNRRAVLEPWHIAGDYKFYRVVKRPGWFLEGSGTVALDYDQILITNPSKGPLILKSHWIKTLVTDPPLPMRPVMVKDDPVAFIGIDNSSGADRILIYNAGL